MASTNDEENFAGRRTRSARKVSTSQPTVAASPARATRRTAKKQIQLSEPDNVEPTQPEPPTDTDDDVAANTADNNSTSQQSDIIKEMLAEAAQGAIIDLDADAGGNSSDIVEVPDDDEDDVTVLDNIIEEVVDEEEIVDEEHKQAEDDEENDYIVYEEQVVEQEPEEDVEMFVIQDDEPQPDEQTPNETVNANSTSAVAAALDEKSSSFPFGNVVQSETSEDPHENEEEVEEEEQHDDGATGGIVESSLLASMAGDNANSLPSVGGGEELDCKKDDFEEKAVEPPEKMDSEDSLSEPAIAEELGEADASSATIVNTEMVSEDELPMPTKPEINDAEEVSDDELPAPQRAELPADAEVISEDELPAAADKKSPTSSPKASEMSSGRQKRKAEQVVNEEEDNEEMGEDTERQQLSEQADEQANDDGETQPKKKAHKAAKESSNEQYNPMSPTSESNDAPPVEKKAKLDGEDTTHSSEHREKEKKKERKEREREHEKERKKLPDLDKYWRSVKEDPADFTGWTYLLQYVDNESDAEAAREAYDAFLAHYPYCYGYWRKYADYEKRKGIKANCNTVFERGLKAIPLSVDLWIHYLSHVKSNHSDNEEHIRAQFERAIDGCGLEFRSDKLWDAYIKWEHDHKRYQRVVQIFDRLLAIPTQGYSGHFDNFQDLINQHSLTSTISAAELIKIRSELRESTSSRSKSKEHRAESREKDKESKSKDRESRDKDRESRDKERDRESRDKDRDRESRDKDRESRDKDRDRESRDKDRESRDKDRDKEPRDKDRDSTDKDRESRHKDRESKDKDRDTKDKDRDSKDKDRDSKDKDRDSKDKDRDSKDKDRDSKDKDRDTKEKEKDSKHAKDEETTRSHKEDNTDDVNVVEASTSEDKPPAAAPIAKDYSDLSTLTDSEMSSIKDKVISIRRKVHKTTVAAVTARWSFEEGIKRPYFHVKPLERCQLKNWKDYLDFEIEKGDRKRILVLFERCLIACALYDEFWLKMIRYLETIIEQPGMAALTSNVYQRACEIHHPDKPSLHLMWAAFEECQLDFDRAAAVLQQLEQKCPHMLQVAYRRINLERRRGETSKCKELYEHYIATAKNKTIAGSLAIKYARFLNKICEDLDGGLRVLRQTLDKDLGNTRVALQMIDLMLQRTNVDEDEVVLVMDKFMARENIDPEQKVLFAQRKVEFLEDFGSTAKGLQEAQRGLQLALSRANDAKKKRESSPSRKSSSSAMKDGMMSSAAAQAASAYNNGTAAASANYNYNSANAAYYGQQNSAAYQQSYDGYYNQWQYGSGGSGGNYSGYGQWSGYGNYY